MMTGGNHNMTIDMSVTVTVAIVFCHAAINGSITRAFVPNFPGLPQYVPRSSPYPSPPGWCLDSNAPRE